MRRTVSELDSKIKKTLERMGNRGGSIREIAVNSGINWKTTKNILEKFENLGLVERVFTHNRLKVYRIKK
jgi:predicted transcriptional regulator